MSLFQIGGFAFLGALCFWVGRGIRVGRIPRYAAAVWLLLCVIAAVLIADPRLTVLAARALGIGRGADLVFYSAILGSLFGSFLFYVRIRRIENKLTGIVRELAIREALPPSREQQ
ncbi:MAG: DUF2304 domain-containing protein [Bdellovibrionales bacterium]|nr:DUF2304 domain-containing protein [Bdellovibrionales bacterium]